MRQKSLKINDSFSDTQQVHIILLSTHNQYYKYIAQLYKSRMYLKYWEAS